MRKIVSTLLLAAAAPAVALSGTSLAQAAPAHDSISPVLDYRWCPGDRWAGGWGANWDWGHCHDDHFRYDRGWHRHDDWGRPHW